MHLYFSHQNHYDQITQAPTKEGERKKKQWVSPPASYVFYSLALFTLPPLNTNPGPSNQIN
jgi:hypothetical protein